MPAINIANELKHQYEATYVRIKKTGELVICLGFQYSGTVLNQEDPNSVVVTIKDKSNHTTLCLWKDLDPVYPQLGFIHYLDAVIYVSRIPVRQWKRGFLIFNGDQQLITKNILQEDELAWIGRMDDFNSHKMNSWELVEAVFNNKLCAYNTAVKKVNEGFVLSTAFHHKYAIVMHRGFKHPIVYYKTCPIGFVGPNMRVSLHHTMKHLTEELSQYAPVTIWMGND